MFSVKHLFSPLFMFKLQMMMEESFISTGFIICSQSENNFEGKVMPGAGGTVKLGRQYIAFPL